MWLKWPQHSRSSVYRIDRFEYKNRLSRKKRIAPFNSAPPKTPISEVWSKIDKDSKSRPEGQKRSVRHCRIDRFDQKYRFSRKNNSAIRFSAPENPHIRSFVKNRQRFEKSTKSDQKIDKSIASDRSVQKNAKQTSSDISSDPKLSFKPKIMKIGSESAEKRLAEKNRYGRKYGTMNYERKDKRILSPYLQS